MYDHAGFITFKGLYVSKTLRSIYSSWKYQYAACSFTLVASNKKDFVCATGESVSRNQKH